MGVTCTDMSMNKSFFIFDNENIKKIDVFKDYSKEFDKQQIIESSTGMISITSKIEQLSIQEWLKRKLLGNQSLGGEDLSKKQILKQIFVGKDFDINKESQDYHFEIFQQRSINHPVIIKPLEIQHNGDQVQLVFEKPQGNPLSWQISNNEFFGDCKAIIDVVRQMLEILNFLHTNNVMHRNLNPDVFYFNSAICKLYLQDLGSCCSIKDTKEKIKSNLIFSSPEMAHHKSYYNESTDIFSAGIIFYTLIQGHSPQMTRPTDKIDDLRHKILFCKFRQEPSMENAGIPKQIIDFLMLFLKMQPEERTPIDILLGNPVIKEFGNRDHEVIKNKHILEYCLYLEPHQIFSSVIGVQFQLHDQHTVNSLQTSIDKNKDGSLDREEVEDLLGRIFEDIDSKEITDNIFTLLDEDKNEFIDYKDFAIMTFRAKGSIEKFKKFQACLKLLKVKDGKRILYSDLLEVIRINDTDFLHKLENGIGKMITYDKATNTFDIDEFLGNLFMETDLELSQRYQDFQKRMTKIGDSGDMKKSSTNEYVTEPVIIEKSDRKKFIRSKTEGEQRRNSDLVRDENVMERLKQGMMESMSDGDVDEELPFDRNKEKITQNFKDKVNQFMNNFKKKSDDIDPYNLNNELPKGNIYSGFIENMSLVEDEIE